jgi:CDP-6-deoxy-D-xylo-4-hexulose-3-dehydrase
VSPNRYVPSVDQLLSDVTPDTKALMIPNLLGNKPDWRELRTKLTNIGRTDIILIEDSYDTITTTPESDISTVSFYASHTITSGGMVMFNNEE